MKQTGEVYQAKSEKGNARKGENCVRGMPWPAGSDPQWLLLTLTLAGGVPTLC